MAASPPAMGAGRLEPVSPCFAAPSKGLDLGAKVECGYVVLPENAARPDGRQVKIGYARVRSRAAGSAAAPLFMLAGGPGGSMIERLSFNFLAPAMLGELLATRDVVLLEQRGTHHTVPTLDCPAYHRLPWTRHEQGLSAAAADVLQGWVLARCFDDLRRSGIDVSLFNSVAIAADVDAARQALGYQRIVYYGASYGAQLGQHLMRDHPEILEAVVLDGANSQSRMSWVEDRAQDIDFAIGHVDTLCRASQKCHAAYDISALIDRGLALFDDGPIKTSFTDPQDPRTPLRVEVRAEDFAALLYALQGSKIGVGSLPFTLHQLVRDGRKSMGELLGQVVGERILRSRHATAGGLATLMHIAVVCSDDPVRSVDELRLDGVRSRYAGLMAAASAREYVRYCEAAGVPTLPDATDVDVRSSIPTLILSGGLDAATPTYRSEIVAKTLPNVWLVVFADGTHVQLGAINLCAAQVMTAFVRDPVAPLPLDCVERSRSTGFVLPDGTVDR